MNLYSGAFPYLVYQWSHSQDTTGIFLDASSVSKHKFLNWIGSVKLVNFGLKVNIHQRDGIINTDKITLGRTDVGSKCTVV